MATVTWLGQGDPEQVNTWKGLTFKVGEAVECDDPYILEKASGNQYFKVEGYDPEKPPEEVPEEVQIVPAPSTVSAQRPFAKPGEVAPPDLIPPMETVPNPKAKAKDERIVAEDEKAAKWPKI